MNLVRWHPVGELEEMTGPLNRFFARPDTAIEWQGNDACGGLGPIRGYQRNRREFHVKAELPVLKKEDARVTLDKGMLTLQGERKEE